MYVVRIEHEVPDFGAWKQAFDRDPAGRADAGVLRYRVMRAKDAPDLAMVDLEFATSAEAEAFLRRMEAIWAGPGRAVMRGPRARIAEITEAREL